MTSIALPRDPDWKPPGEITLTLDFSAERAEAFRQMLREYIAKRNTANHRYPRPLRVYPHRVAWIRGTVFHHWHWECRSCGEQSKDLMPQLCQAYDQGVEHLQKHT